MKKLFILMSMALSCFVFTACGDDEEDIPGTGGEEQVVDENTGETSVTGGVENIYITGAEVVCYHNINDATLLNFATFGVVYSAKSGVNFDNKDGYVSTESLEGNKYKVTISGLVADTKYYYRSYACIGSNYVYGAEKSFTTKGVKVTAELTEQEGRTATFSCTSNLESFDLQNPYNSYGLVWGTSADVKIGHTKDYKSADELTDGKYTIKVDNLIYFTEYYYRAYTHTGGKDIYSEVKSFTIGDKTNAKIGNAVDLGLSVKWADMNVGASSPEDYGDFFAWGEDKSKEYYDWSNYKWCNGTYDSLTKYRNASYSGKYDLDPTDDAAHVNWGSAWRMPTDSEMHELRTQCTWTWTTQVGVKGYKVTAPNGNSIFLPATSRKGNLSRFLEGYYWSSSQVFGSPSKAHCLYFYSDYIELGNNYLYSGSSVRPVCK